MSIKREPLLSDEQMDEICEVHPYHAQLYAKRTAVAVDALHEAARAKDAELIQRLVDGLKHAQKFAEEYGYGPLETVQWDLDVAAAAGFKPTEQ